MSKSKKWGEEVEKEDKEPDSDLTPKDPPAVDPEPLPESKELIALKAQIEKTWAVEVEANTALVKTAEEICQNKAKPEKVNALSDRLHNIRVALADQTAVVASAADSLKKAEEALSKAFTS